MMIDSAKSARSFVRAWAGHTGAERAYRMAAEAQRSCANLARTDQVAQGHLAAARVLERAAYHERESAEKRKQ